MIYTSYFGNLRRIEKVCPNLFPVSIALYPPNWFRGARYRKLAPTADILREWKEKHDVERYTKRFCDEVTSHLNRDEVIKDLMKLSNGHDAALLCYERPGEFCHRHIVAQWLNRGGYKCEELYL